KTRAREIRTSLSSPISACCGPKSLTRRALRHVPMRARIIWRPGRTSCDLGPRRMESKTPGGWPGVASKAGQDPPYLKRAFNLPASRRKLPRWDLSPLSLGGLVDQLHPQLLGQRKHHVFRLPIQLGDMFSAQFAQPLNNPTHQHFRRRRTRGDTHALAALHPLRIDFDSTVDQISLDTLALGKFAQT